MLKVGASASDGDLEVLDRATYTMKMGYCMLGEMAWLISLYGVERPSRNLAANASPK